MKFPRGLTLIELMATVAITGILVAAALGVATRLSRAEAINERSHEASLPQVHLKNLLASDIIHARFYRKTSNGVEFQLRARLDVKTLEMQHLRSTVGYEIRQIASRRWLLRVQKVPDRQDHTELVCPDVYAVSLGTIKDDRTTASDDWKPVPEVLTVRVEFSEADRKPVAFKFYTR